MGHLWKQFRGLFLTRLGFCFLDYFWFNRGCERCRINVSCLEAISLMISYSVVTQFTLTICDSTGLCALMNPRVTCGSGLVDDFRGDSDSVFLDNIWLNRGCVLSRIQASHVEAFFDDDFWVGSDSTFVGYFWVIRGCVRWRILAWPLEAVSLMIYDSAAT